MKQKLCTLLLVCSLILPLPAMAAKTLPFSDVPEKSWYYTYVSELYTSGIIGGMTSTSFVPNGTVSVGQALKLILLSAGYPEKAPTSSHWASGYLSFATQNNLIPSSLPQNLDSPISRVQIAEAAVQVFGLTRKETTRSPFNDTTNAAALILYDHGIITGVQSGNVILFNPDSNITRAEMSTIIWRLYEMQKSDTPETPTEPDPPTKPEKPTEPEKPTMPETPTEPETPSQSGEYFYFYGHKIYVAEGVPKRSYNSSLFSYNNNGFLTYNSKDYDSKIGIDVSRYQGDIDWAQVKATGVDFAILRAGYRGYASGAMVTDSYFKKNAREALAEGIELGVYFFSQAITPQEGAEEANYVLKLIEDYDITYPVVFDWEPYDSSLNPRTDGLSDRVLTQCAVSFCNTVKKAGYTPMVYANLTYFYRHYDLSKLVDYPIWLAQYTSKPTFYYHFDMWQYSSSGKVPGIKGDVDLNLYLVPKK